MGRFLVVFSQIGFGHLPNAILKFLDSKKDLGIHTQVITDGFLPLLEKKVITNKKKSFLPGKVVASLCMGSRRIYDYVDKNPMFVFLNSEFVNDLAVIARNDNLISISSAPNAKGLPAGRPLALLVLMPELTCHYRSAGCPLRW